MPKSEDGSLYLVHGIEQLGELIETLPVLARVLLTLYDGFTQLLDVRHPNIVEHRLALQAILWHCERREIKQELVNIQQVRILSKAECLQETAAITKAAHVEEGSVVCLSCI